MFNTKKIKFQDFNKCEKVAKAMLEVGMNVEIWQLNDKKNTFEIKIISS
jgi:hypothetical protein